MEDTITNAIRQIVREEIAHLRPPALPPIEPVPAFRQYSVKSAAQILDTSEDYVLARIKDGSLPRIVDLGSSRSKLRIHASDLQRFIDSHTSFPAAQS